MPMAANTHAGAVAVALLLTTLQAASVLADAYTDAIHSRNMAAAKRTWREYQKWLLETEHERYRDTVLGLTEYNTLARKKGDGFDCELPSIVVSERTELGIRGYEIVDIAGCGIEGKVVKCRDKDGKTVAVKITDYSSHEHAHNVLKTIQSPYVVGTVDHFACKTTMSPRFFHVMEYVEGATLERHMRSRAACSLEAWRDVVVQLAEALVAVRDAKLCHGDVKAENVVVTPEGGLRLVDFGHAGPEGCGRDDDARSLAALVFRLASGDIRDLRWCQDAGAILRGSGIEGRLEEVLQRLLGGEKCYEEVAACARGAGGSVQSDSSCQDTEKHSAAKEPIRCVCAEALFCG